jgi:hypothetical protein
MRCFGFRWSRAVLGCILRVICAGVILFLLGMGFPTHRAQAGLRWRPIALRGAVVWDIALFVQEGRTGLYAGTDAGLYRCLSSVPGAAFDCRRVGGVPAGDVYAVSCSSDGSRVVAALGSPAEIRYTANSGMSWSTAITETLGYTFVRRDENVLLLGTVGKGLWQSNTRGQGWFRPGGSIAVASTVPAITLEPGANPSQAWASVLDSGIYYSNDLQSWSPKNTNLKNAMALTAMDAQTLLAGDDRGKIYKSTNYGGNWSVKSTIPDAAFIYSLARQSERIAYAGTFGQGVWITEDGGETWREIGGLSGYARYVYSLKNSLANGQQTALFAATADGVWLLLSPGTTFIPLTSRRYH